VSNVVEFDGLTTLDIPAERVLKVALEEKLNAVVIMGWDKDGDFYASSSIADGGEALWLMELMKQKLMEGI
jgi:hypothetical protein